MPFTSIFLVIVSVYSAIYPNSSFSNIATVVFAGLVFIVSGNYFPKNHVNKYIGLKFPWLLNDEENWDKTHKLASYTWILAGIIFILQLFISPLKAVSIPLVIIAVSDLNITIADGDLYGFIGKACLTIHDYNTGDILLNGVSIKSAPTECKKRMAYVPDTPILYPDLTGLQYLNFICDIYNVSEEKRKQKIPALSKQLGMNEKLNDLISSYSHGMKQKISLIGAFIHEPKLLILDEPFVGLDPEAFIQLKALMKALCASGGSVLFSSHVLDVVEKTCNKIAIIRNGELIRSGETKEILGNRDLENVFMELNGK